MQAEHDRAEQEVENILDSIPQSIICEFVTHLTELRVEQGEVDLSTSLDEEGLNKIVRELLESTVDQQTLDKISFDFLVEGKLLRGKINSHLVRYQIGCEKVVQIEYFIAFRNLEEATESPEEDWVSSICAVMGEERNIGVLTAMFNGTVSFHKKSSKKLPKDHAKVHQDPIKAIKCQLSPQPDVYYAITGGLGQELKVSTFRQGQSFSSVSHNEFSGSILALDVNPTEDGHFCAAGSEGVLSVFKIPEDFLEEDYNELATAKKKKKKTNTKMVPKITDEACHQAAINSICWFNTSQIATGSSDHSIKILDVAHMRVVKTILTKDSITTSLDYSNDSLISSHEDGYIRLWDIRNPITPAATFKSHSKYASCLSFSSSSHIFASGSYDQTVKIWDTRSVFPLQSIATNYDKVFSVAWLDSSTVVSGGSSPHVTFHTA